MGEAPPKERRETAALPPEALPRVLELSHAFLGVEHALGFYPPGHQARRAPVARLLAALRAFAAGEGGATLGFAEDQLLLEGKLRGPLPATVRKMVETFVARGIAGLAWTADVEEAEVEAVAGRIVARRGAAEVAPWGPEDSAPHLRVEGVDYQGLMAEEGGDAEGQRQRSLWLTLLRRLVADPAAELSPEELGLLAGGWGDPAALATWIAEGIAGAAGEEAAVGALRRLAEAVEAGPPGVAASHETALRAAARELPPALRLRLVEAAIEAGRPDLFARALGSPEPGEVAALLARNFLLDPGQIARLTRVLQHLVPRQLDRMELFPLLRSEVQRGTVPEEAVPENAWEEVQELLTGEAGEFMSSGYRELLERLAAREQARRDAEGTLADLPDLEPDLEPERTAEESVAILAEQLGLATGAEPFGEAVAALAAAAAAAFAAGETGRGARALAALCDAAAPEAEPAGPRDALLAALAGAATPEALAALAGAATEGSRPARAALRGLAAAAPGATAAGLVDLLAAEADGGRRAALAAALGELGAAALPEVSRRLGDAPAPAARVLLAAVAGTRDAAAVPGLASLLAREDRLLRRDAVRALAQVEGAEARRVLAGVLGDEDEEVVRLAAARLGALEDRGAVAALLRQLDAAVGHKGRGGPEALRAIAALGWMRAPEAVAPLAALLGRRGWFGRRGPDEFGEAAAHALARIGGGEARRALEAAAAGAPGPLAATIRRLLARGEGAG